ncbi:hypothetical protein IV203_038291 [Nitzschia inconspicua]|uniref:Secreted protein n=1 Tax=Nitzschia inconspicua TaxID=303405 RepID=A0A9K3LNL7_9STRA|nr:hypothetical protein IV203_038291 [Nitzschia inconspicua]
MALHFLLSIVLFAAYRLSWHFPQNRFCPNLRGCRPFMALLSPFMAFPSKSILPQPERMSAFHGLAIAFHGISLKIGSAPTCEDVGLSWPCYRLSWHFPQNRFCPNLRGCRPFMALVSPIMASPSKTPSPSTATICVSCAPADPRAIVLLNFRPSVITRTQATLLAPGRHTICLVYLSPGCIPARSAHARAGHWLMFTITLPSHR